MALLPDCGTQIPLPHACCTAKQGSGDTSHAVPCQPSEQAQLASKPDAVQLPWAAQLMLEHSVMFELCEASSISCCGPASLTAATALRPEPGSHCGETGCEVAVGHCEGLLVQGSSPSEFAGHCWSVSWPSRDADLHVQVDSHHAQPASATQCTQPAPNTKPLSSMRHSGYPGK